MQQSRSFACPVQRYEQLVSQMQNWLISEKFDCQRLAMEDGGSLLQFRKKGRWRKFAGMSTALNVVFRQDDNTVNVEIGEGRWVDKVAVATVGAFVLLWPLAITAGIGAVAQWKLPGRVLDRVAHYLSQPS